MEKLGQKREAGELLADVMQEFPLGYYAAAAEKRLGRQAPQPAVARIRQASSARPAALPAGADLALRRAETLREAGLDLLLYNFSQMKGRERLFQHQMLKGRVDGLIVISVPPTEEEFESMLSLGIPVSLVGMHHSRCSSVAIDDVAAARTATQHLVNQGHKKIGLISGSPHDPFNFSVPQDRRNGFMQVLAESGLEWLPSREVYGDFTMHGASRAVDDLLARPNRPTAIFAQSDEMALGALQAFRRHGLKVPDDISIIGFDGHEMSEFSDLTTMEQQPSLMGEMAAWSIMERLKAPKSELHSITLPTTLIVRNSTRRLTDDEG